MNEDVVAAFLSNAEISIWRFDKRSQCERLRNHSLLMASPRVFLLTCRPTLLHSQSSAGGRHDWAIGLDTSSNRDPMIRWLSLIRIVNG